MCLHVLWWRNVGLRMMLMLMLRVWVWVCIRKVLVDLYRWWLTRRRHGEMVTQDVETRPGVSRG